MHLSDHDLRQLDEVYLDGLTPEQARALLGRALADLKAARERLNQNPSNSSRPPSSRPPWETRETGEVPASDPETPGEATVSDSDATAGETPTVPAKAPPAPGEETTSERRPGRRRGAPGHSRTQRLAVDAERTHAPICCHGCGEPLSPASESRAHNARYAIDLIQPGAGATGLVLHQTKHTYLEWRCVCGHWTQAEPGRAEAEAEWTVATVFGPIATWISACAAWPT
jgi:transposase